MVVHMRHTRGHTRNRRSHHALKARALSVCEKCKSRTLPHRACSTCGSYRGRVVVDVIGTVAKKDAKRKKKAEALKKAK